jgi:hypothetical protein
VDNGGALIGPFILSLGSRRRVVKGRDATVVELQWCRLWEIKMGKER